MTDTSDKNSNNGSKAPDAASQEDLEYKVGYGKPPKHSQFKKGQSGNPPGRPRKTSIKPPSHPLEPFKDALLKAARRTVKTDDGQRITMAEAVAHSIVTNAAKGHFQAQKLLTQLITNIELKDKQEKEEIFKTALDYKHEWEHKLNIIRESGLEEPDIVPHPDHIELNPFTLGVTINGPATEEQKKMRDFFLARRDEAIRRIREGEQALKKTRSPKKRKWYEDNIETEKNILENVLKGLQSNKR